MPLIKIPNQPYFANPRPTDCFSCDEREYKIPVQPGDPVYMQFKQTPCGPSQVCDGDFSSLTDDVESICDTEFDDLGAEEITNGTFTGSATGWTLQTDWTYGSNKITKTTGGGVSSSAIQNIAGGFLAANGVYKVTFTISGWTGSGIITPVLFGPSFTFYPGDSINANGTYTQYIKVGSDANQFILTASDPWEGSIDTVSIRRVAACWDFGGNENDGWSIDEDGFAHTIHRTGPGISQYGIPYNNASGASIFCDCLQPNTNYLFNIEVEDGNGIISFSLGGAPTTFYNLTGGAQTINFTATSGGSTIFEIFTFGASKVKISEASAIEVTGECWDFEDNQWSSGTNALCHIPGTASTLTNATTFLANKYYQIKFTVSGRTAGTFNFALSNVLYAFGAFAQPYENKDYVAYMTPAVDGQLIFYATSAFDGCFSNIEVFELKNDIVFDLVDADENFVSHISDYDSFKLGNVLYYEDFITVKFLFGAQPYGCYRVMAYDTCEVQYDEIIKDGEFLNPMSVYWLDTSSGVTTITGGRLQENLTAATAFIVIPNYYLSNNGTGFQDNPAIPLGSHNYRITFDIIQNDDTSNISAGIFGGGQIGTYFSTVGTHTVDMAFDPTYNVPPRQWFAVVFRYLNASTGIIKIDNVSVRRIEPFTVTLKSELIQYGSNFKCTKFIQAYCDDDNLGFKFNKGHPGVDDIFKIAHRIYLRAINDVFPEDSSDYLYSDGTKSTHFGQTAQSFLLVTDQLPASAHEAIRVQRRCQHFEIGEPLDSFKEWFVVPGDYVPEWNKNGESKLAPARFEIQEKENGTKFMRNV